MTNFIVGKMTNLGFEGGSRRDMGHGVVFDAVTLTVSFAFRILDNSCKLFVMLLAQNTYLIIRSLYIISEIS